MTGAIETSSFIYSTPRPEPIQALSPALLTAPYNTTLHHGQRVSQLKPLRLSQPPFRPRSRPLTAHPQNSWSLIISIVFIIVFSAAAWFFSPKGDTQTVWRSTLILSAWSCWLMWGTCHPSHLLAQATAIRE